MTPTYRITLTGLMDSAMLDEGIDSATIQVTAEPQRREMLEETEQVTASQEDRFEIVVDTVPHVVHEDRVTWRHVVDIGYPGQAEDPKYKFKVQYEDAESHPTSGSLTKGHHVTVKRHGTIFSVLRSLVS